MTTVQFFHSFLHIGELVRGKGSLLRGASCMLLNLFGDGVAFWWICWGKKLSFGWTFWHVGVFVGWRGCLPKRVESCRSNLIENHRCRVKLYTLAGIHEVEKVTLRCVRCKISYNYDKWGDKIDNGFRYYPVARNFVEVNDTTYFERQLQNLQCSLAYVVLE